MKFSLFTGFIVDMFDSISNSVDMFGDFVSSHVDHSLLTAFDVESTDHFDSDFGVNPATGLPMMDDVLDVGGNIFGSSSADDVL